MHMLKQYLDLYFYAADGIIFINKALGKESCAMSLFSSGVLNALYQVLIRLVVAVTALPVHEFAHGYVAYRLGDDTAKQMGRLTLNPLRHFDPFGTTMMLLTGFGWAKPVPVNASRFKNPKNGMALTAVAGPLANLLLAFISMIGYKVVYWSATLGGGASSVTSVLANIFMIMLSINVSLAAFNLLPIPPLDGSRVASVLLPQEAYFKLMKAERVIMVLLFIAMFWGILDKPLGYIRNFAVGILDWATRPVDMIFKIFL